MMIDVYLEGKTYDEEDFGVIQSELEESIDVLCVHEHSICA